MILPLGDLDLRLEGKGRKQRQNLAYVTSPGAAFAALPGPRLFSIVPSGRKTVVATGGLDPPDPCLPNQNGWSEGPLQTPPSLCGFVFPGAMGEGLGGT